MTQRYAERLLVERTNPELPGATTIDATVLTTALNDAAAEIDSYLGAYSLPLSSVPARLVRINCTLALAYLYSDANIDNQNPPLWWLEARAARQDLNWIAEGRITLPVNPAEGGNAISAMSVGPDPVFDDAGLTGY